MNAETLRENIRRCKELTDKPFGVNIMLMHPQADEFAKIVVEEGVKVVTTGAGNPGKYIPMWKEAGIKSYVATSKPTVHARAICEKFGISQRVELVAGSTLGGSETKADVIQQVLDTIGPQAEGQAVMVGDRKYDVIGAREKHLPVILVGFGYGSKAEQEAYPPDYFAPDVAALGNIILHTHS
jgi:phosphoglycolate phosphatase-like HAD superfamily hydrolase